MSLKVLSHPQISGAVVQEAVLVPGDWGCIWVLSEPPGLLMSQLFICMFLIGFRSSFNLTVHLMTTARDQLQTEAVGPDRKKLINLFYSTFKTQFSSSFFLFFSFMLSSSSF